jgi:hypothetical protein
MLSLTRIVVSFVGSPSILNFHLPIRNFTNMDSLHRTVFRLQGIPGATNDFSGVANLLSSNLGQCPIKSIHVFSLASSLYPYNSPRPKVATLKFTTAPSCINDRPDADQWTISCASGTLILDTHFLGMTPLNDVDHSVHRYEYVA